MACGPSSERPRGVLALFLALNREGQGRDAVEDEGAWDQLADGPHYPSSIDLVCSDR